MLITRIHTACLATIILLAFVIYPATSSISTASPTGSNQQINAKILLESLTGLDELTTLETQRIKNDSTSAQSIYQKIAQAKASEESARNLAQQGRYTEAVEKVYEAMHLFKEAIVVIDQNANQTEAVTQTERLLALKMEASRAYRYLQGVEAQATKAGNLGYNITKIDSMITQAKQDLKNIAAATEKADAAEASKLLGVVKTKLAAINSLVYTLSTRIKLARANTYMLQAQKRVTVLRSNISAVSAKLPPVVVSGSLNALNQAQASLDAAKNYYQNNKTAETANALKNFSLEEQKAITILKSANITVASSITP